MLAVSAKAQGSEVNKALPALAPLPHTQKWSKRTRAGYPSAEIPRARVTPPRPCVSHAGATQAPAPAYLHGIG